VLGHEKGALKQANTLVLPKNTMEKPEEEKKQTSGSGD